MFNERQNRYKTGWNDVANGILDWIPHPGKWDSALEWAVHMMVIAEECKKTCALHCVDYFDGVIACVEEYQRTGRIARK